MRIKEYPMFRNESSLVFCVKENGLFYIKERSDSFWNSRGLDIPYIEDKFLHLRVLWESSYEHDKNFYYIIVEKQDRKGRIMDLKHPMKKIIEDFPYSNFKGMTKTHVDDVPMQSGEYEVEDRIVKFIDEKKKEFALFSLLKEKFIYGPLEYSAIEDLGFGIILNDKTFIDNEGNTIDMSGFELLHGHDVTLYYNKEKDEYLMLIDIEEPGLYWTDKENNILKCETQNWIFEYNMETEQFDYHNKYENEMTIDEYLHQWDDCRDIAYEGYSETSLGID